jgi:hypothetical protein
MPQLQKGLGVSIHGNIVQKWQQWRLWGMHSLEYGTPTRKAITVAKPLGALALLAAVAAAAGIVAHKMTNDSRPARRTARTARGRLHALVEHFS